MFGEQPATAPDTVTNAKIADWWREVYVPIRAKTFADLRPDARIRDLPCTATRAKAIGARLRAACPSEPWSRQREILTHVVRCAEAKVYAQGGRKVDWGSKKYDTMKNILPEYWLAASHFDDLLDSPEPEPARRDVAPKRDPEFMHAEPFDEEAECLL